MTRTRWLRGLAPVVVLAIAAALRFWALDRPGTLVFDELYYVRDAISQLAHGFPTTWPDDEPDMSGARATSFGEAPSNAVHPPLGKWLIGLGVLAFGPGGGWGWRSAVAAAGVLTVAVTMRLAWRMTRNLAVACIAGLLLAIDGVHVTLTRVGLLDGFLALAITIGALFMWRDIEQASERAAAQMRGGAPPSGRIAATALRVEWRRPWLVAAAAVFGAGAAIKWSGLYPLAAFLVFVAVRDLVVRVRAARGQRIAGPGSGSAPRAVGRAVLQGLVTAAIALPAACAAYLASWFGWIVRPGGWGRTEGDPWLDSLLAYHADMLQWHSTLTAAHPYAAHPLTWPLALRPTGMYEARWGSAEGCPWHECVAAISAIPNPLVTWGGVLALLALACVLIFHLRRGPSALSTVAAFVLAGYLSGWVPWVLTFSRSAVFQFYAVVLTPFSAIALALALGLLCRAPIEPRLPDARAARSRAHDPTDAAGAIGAATAPSATAPSARTASPENFVGVRIAAAIFLVIALALSLAFFPVWSAMPIAEWFWRAHLWLPGWG